MTQLTNAKNLPLSKLLETAKILLDIRNEEPQAYACLPTVWHKILTRYPKQLYQSYRLHGIQVGTFPTQADIDQYVKDMAWAGKNVTIIVDDDLIEEEKKA